MKKRQPLHVLIGNFFVGLFKSIRFGYHYFQRMIKYGNCIYPYHSCPDNNVIRVLATGPSLKKEIEELLSDGSLFSAPIFAMNFFAMSDLFLSFKPTRYCLADPGFFKEREKENRLYEILNKEVTWNMKLYIPNVSMDIATRKIQNYHIALVPISTLHFEGFESNRNLFYKRGFATPSFVNVLIMIEYICLNEGFSKILLYGADHTFLSNLSVDDCNVLRIGDSHFDGDAVVARYHNDGTPWRISEFIYDKYLTFKEHDIMRCYADYLGARIINCTQCSLIDSYERLAQVKG